MKTEQSAEILAVEHLTSHPTRFPCDDFLAGTRLTSHPPSQGEGPGLAAVQPYLTLPCHSHIRDGTRAPAAGPSRSDAAGNGGKLGNQQLGNLAYKDAVRMRRGGEEVVITTYADNFIYFVIWFYNRSQSAYTCIHDYTYPKNSTVFSFLVGGHLNFSFTLKCHARFNV